MQNIYHPVVKNKEGRTISKKLFCGMILLYGGFDHVTWDT